MEKRLPLKSPQLPEKYPTGCRWGFMRFFDLFNGHSSQKLISNASHFDWHKKGNYSVSDRPKLLPASDKKYRDEKKNPCVDPRFASICNSRRRRHEEYFSKSLGYCSKKNGKMDQIHVYSTHHGKDAKGRWKLYRADSAGRVSNSTLTGVFCGYGCRNIGCVSNGVAGSKVQSAHVTDTTEAVVSRKLISWTGNESKELSEALEVLNSNKELFRRLLGDPNSLLARHIKDLHGSQGKRPRTELFMRQHKGNGLNYGSQEEDGHSISLRRVKSQESSALKRNCCTKQSNGVILKPQSDFSVRNKLLNVRQSYLLFRRLRRKLRWTQQKKFMSSNVEVGAASAHEVSFKSGTDLSLKKDCENRREHKLEFSNWRDGIKKSSEKNFQRNLRSLSLPSYPVKDNGEPRLLRETKTSLSSPLKLNVDPLSSGCNKSDDQSKCLESSFNLVLSTETQETVTTLAHMSSEGSKEIEILQEDPSSSPGNTQEHANPVTVEDQVDQSEYDQTDGMRCPLGSRMIVSGPNHDLRATNDYVKAVLVAADLDWDGLLVNSNVSDQILRPSSFDEVKILCNRSDINQRLLFDYINEVLEEVRHCYQTKSRTFAVEKNVTHAVMKRMYRDQDLFLHKGSPTLEQLVIKDLAYFTKWIDIQSNTEEIVTELVEDILEDILNEI